MYIGDKVKVKSGRGTKLLFENLEYTVLDRTVLEVEAPGVKPGTIDAPTERVDMVRIHRGLVEGVNYGAAWYEESRFIGN